MLTQKGTVLKITAGRVSEPMLAEIISEGEIASLAYEVKDASGAVVYRGSASEGGTRVTFSASFDAKAWSAEHPVLYTLFVNITYQNGEREEISDRFGFRYFSSDKSYIYLNGFPLYMRAYIRGCAAHEHQNNAGLLEYDFYIQVEIVDDGKCDCCRYSRSQSIAVSDAGVRYELIHRRKCKCRNNSEQCP